MQKYVLIIFLKTLPYQQLYFADKFQNTDNFAWNCRLLKIVGKIQQLVRKRSQKNHYNIILHCISLPIYPLNFPQFYLIQKQ